MKAPSNHFELRIAPVKVELAPGVVIDTVGYNGQVPGPILRVKEGMPVDIHVMNHSDVPELVHWHGLHIDAINDGSSEEGSPVIAPGGELRYSFMPAPSGSRWYHTHTMAHDDLRRAGYSGQYGFFYIEPKSGEAGAYDHEVFLAVHHWEPSITHAGTPLTGHEVGYRFASFNDKLASAHEPLHVKQGQRVLFHFLNASATRDVQIALPNHQFRVIALDGNPVPSPQLVNVISLAVAERVDAVVEMNSPGVWMLGAMDDEDRSKGLGLPIEYAGQKGSAMWTPPGKNDWSYALFAHAAPAAAFTQRVPMVFEKTAGKNGMDLWTINGGAYPEIAPLKVTKGDRYRLAFFNTTGEAHPMHLHRHSFELAAINGKPMSGVFKDVVNVDAYSRIDVDFVAENPGPSLFHCHQQMHMDFGFMQLIEYLPES